jgi:hypothetical protein
MHAPSGPARRRWRCAGSRPASAAPRRRRTGGGRPAARPACGSRIITAPVGAARHRRRGACWARPPAAAGLRDPVRRPQHDQPTAATAATDATPATSFQRKAVVGAAGCATGRHDRDAFDRLVRRRGERLLLRQASRQPRKAPAPGRPNRVRASAARRPPGGRRARWRARRCRGQPPARRARRPRPAVARPPGRKSVRCPFHHVSITSPRGALPALARLVFQHGLDLRRNRLARPEDPGTHRADRAIHHFRDLFVAQPSISRSVTACRNSSGSASMAELTVAAISLAASTVSGVSAVVSSFSTPEVSSSSSPPRRRSRRPPGRA